MLTTKQAQTTQPAIGVETPAPAPEAAAGAFVDPEPIDWEQECPRSFYARHGHRALDLVLLTIALPLAAIPAFAIALVNAVVFGDPRQILFVQERVGFRGKRFAIYKFRTMRAARESSMDSWTQGQDTLRVTRFGRFLRNAHLDELPQLLNVLKGDMSFIGPRPEMVEIEDWAASRVPGFSRRLALRPGISGYAQITQGYTGCDEEAYAEKLAINEHYLRTISLRTDLEIVLRTIVWMMRGKGWDWKPAPVDPTAVRASSGRAATEKSVA